jgi:hypothetical protein
MPNVIDGFFDAMEGIVGGLETADKYAKDRPDLREKKIDTSDAIDAEIVDEDDTPIEIKKESQSPSHKIDHLRLDIFTSIGMMRSDSERKELGQLLKDAVRAFGPDDIGVSFKDGK